MAFYLKLRAFPPERLLKENKLNAERKVSILKHTPIAEYFEGRRRALAALSQSLVTPHPGLVGTAREVVVSEFLQLHLPPVLAIGTGMIIGHNWVNGRMDEISTQQDIVIHRRDFPVLSMGGHQLYFRESVVATFEIRTNYVTSDLTTLLKTASSVRKVEPTPTSTLQMGVKGPRQMETPRRVLCGVFYFRKPKARIDMVSKLNAILQSETKTPEDLSAVHGPDFFYSIDSGLIVRNHEFNTLSTKGKPVKGFDAVSGGLQGSESKHGAYRRAFGHSENWRGLHTITLELTERCQRYATSYASLSEYV